MYTHLHLLFALNAFMWIIFYAFIDSFIFFLIDIIYTIVNQTLHSIKNEQLVILQITWKCTHQNQFDRCCWWEKKREKEKEQNRQKWKYSFAVYVYE